MAQQRVDHTPASLEGPSNPQVAKLGFVPRFYHFGHLPPGLAGDQRNGLGQETCLEACGRLNNAPCHKDVLIPGILECVPLHGEGAL